MAGAGAGNILLAYCPRPVADKIRLTVRDSESVLVQAFKEGSITKEGYFRLTDGQLITRYHGKELEGGSMMTSSPSTCNERGLIIRRWSKGWGTIHVRHPTQWDTAGLVLFPDHELSQPTNIDTHHEIWQAPFLCQGNRRAKLEPLGNDEAVNINIFH